MYIDTPFLIHEPRRPAVPERDVERMWLQRARPEVSFASVQGQTVRVIDAGTRNRHDGPDFLGASVVVDGALRRGDVELHVSPEDWQRHGHDRDPRYARVVLHVCLYDGAFPRHIPGIVLASQLGQPFRTAWEDARRDRRALACLPADDGAPAAVEAMIVLLAAWRFARKTARLQRRLDTLQRARGRHGMTESASSRCVRPGRLQAEHDGAPPTTGEAARRGADGPAAFRQLVYESFARAAGYGGNEEAFERLSRALPLQALAALPSDRRLEQLLAKASALDWHSSGVMPHNRALRRLRWFAAWAPRLDSRDWWREAIARARRGERDAASWLPLFRGSGEDAVLSSVGEQAGPGRVAEFVINVLAPALYVLATQRGDATLARRAAALYFSVTPAPGNRFTRLIEHGFGLPRIDAGAQQGMIELAAEFCLPRRCPACLRGAAGGVFHAAATRAATGCPVRLASLPR